MWICGSTDLPPLTLAVVLLEQTLVVGDTVLAEHESVESQTEIVSHIVYQGVINQFIQFHRPSSLHRSTGKNHR